MRGGFLLLELLISLVLGGLIVVATVTFMCSAFFNSRCVMKTCSDFSAFVFASSFVEELLAHAPADRKGWKKIASDEMVWKDGDKDCGLSLEKEGLVFIEGDYNHKKCSWETKSNTSLLLQQVKELKFEVGRRQLMDITYTITTATESVEKIVYCLSGAHHTLGGD